MWPGIGIVNTERGEDILGHHGGVEAEEVHVLKKSSDEVEMDHREEYLVHRKGRARYRFILHAKDFKSIE